MLFSPLLLPCVHAEPLYWFIVVVPELSNHANLVLVDIVPNITASLARVAASERIQ